MKLQEQKDKYQELRRHLQNNVKERVQNSKLRELEIKRKQEEASKFLVEKFIEEDQQFSLK